MNCYACEQPGAGLRFKTQRRGPWWFHPKCWLEARKSMAFTSWSESDKVRKVEPTDMSSAGSHDLTDGAVTAMSDRNSITVVR